MCLVSSLSHSLLKPFSEAVDAQNGSDSKWKAQDVELPTIVTMLHVLWLHYCFSPDPVHLQWMLPSTIVSNYYSIFLSY